MFATWQDAARKRLRTSAAPASQSTPAAVPLQPITDVGVYNGDWSADCGLDESGREHARHAFIQVWWASFRCNLPARYYPVRGSSAKIRNCLVVKLKA